MNKYKIKVVFEHFITYYHEVEVDVEAEDEDEALELAEDEAGEIDEGSTEFEWDEESHDTQIMEAVVLEVIGETEEFVPRCNKTLDLFDFGEHNYQTMCINSLNDSSN